MILSKIQNIVQRTQRIDFQKHIVQSQIWTTCLNCEHFNALITTDGYTGEERTGCDLAAHAMPPPRVIVHGCDTWLGEIPF